MNAIFSKATVCLFVVGFALVAPGIVCGQQLIAQPPASGAGPSLDIFAEANDPLLFSNVTPITSPVGAPPPAQAGNAFDINSLIANTSFTGTPAALGAPSSPFGANLSPFSSPFTNNPYSYSFTSYYGPGASLASYQPSDANYTVRYNNYLRSVNYANELYANQYSMYLQAVTALNQQRLQFQSQFAFNPFAFGYRLRYF